MKLRLRPAAPSGASRRANPVFYAEELASLLADDPARLDRMRTDPRSVELLTWNVFASLDRHVDDDWLGHRLQLLGGDRMRGPLRISLWAGRDRQPLLLPSPAALADAKQRLEGVAGADAAVAELAAPVEVPVRIESPEVLLLVDTTLGGLAAGAGGRDRLVELVEVGLEQARRLSRTLAVCVVYPSGQPGAAEASARVNALRSATALAAALPWRERLTPGVAGVSPASPQVVLRDVSWQQLLALWEAERDYLDLDGQPVKAFIEHVRALGLR